MEWSAKTLEKIVPELRIYRRYLFLDRPEYKNVFRIQAVILKAVRDFLYDKGFVELLAPAVSPVTDPGIREAREFTVQFYDEQAVLVTSAILYKFAGLKIHDKIFYVAVNIRKEPPRLDDFSTSLSEFRQIDIEVAHVTREDIMRLTEELLIYTIERVKKECSEELEALGRDLRVPHKPFKVITFEKALEIVSEAGYGIDRSGELSKEAERYLSQIHEEPLWIVDYPPHVRGFYYRREGDKLRDMDLLYPEGFGEAASGGEREVDPVRVRKKMLETGVDPRKYVWLFELLYSGVPPCSGIGLGVERLTRYITGVRDIIDAIPFPKAPGYLGI
ncbi:MAG: asparagine synthetase A [Candidatus Njordarchaeales archaeon]